MLSELSSISPEEKLEALRKLDIFRRWDSLDEKRLCIRCGQIISGREIKVFGGKSGQDPLRLECPTEGCAAVPIEWLMLEPPPDPLPANTSKTIPPALPPQKDDGKPPRHRHHPMFGFLRVTPLLV
ncbi:MAG TPA: hypothetical protein VII74_05815 [Chthoniobacterales bacterium]